MDRIRITLHRQEFTYRSHFEDINTEFTVGH